jgi:tetrachlorobenzoquinone reductase
MTHTLNAFVHTLKFEAQDILSLELRPLAGEVFPPFEAGSHIDLHLPHGIVRSYSLLNDSRERHRYVVAVLKDKSSRGGSRAVHEDLRIAMPLQISEPRNNFKLIETAEHSVLVAGGIGITPILSMAQRLHQLGRSFEVIYCARSRRSAAYVADIEALAAQVSWHFDDEQGGPPDLQALLAARPGVGAVNTHYYACGPAVMLDAFERSCRDLGYAHAHIERFQAVEVAAASDAQQSYTVELKRSGQTLTVMPNQSLLATLQAAGIYCNTSCEEGICGSCETQVLEGIPDHRDSVLSPAEQATHKMMMVCVSGCKSPHLVLDL